MTGEKVVNIIWEGPFKGDEAKTRKGGAFYAIYGPHNVYGVSALLYIGKSDRGDIGARIKEHKWGQNERGTEIQFYIGSFGSHEDAQVANVLDVERLLIYAHGPGYNSHCVADPSPEDIKRLQPLRILNWRSYRSLLPEVSGRRWLTPCPSPSGLSKG
jgi:hypothetical protein